MEYSYLGSSWAHQELFQQQQCCLQRNISGPFTHICQWRTIGSLEGSCRCTGFVNNIWICTVWSFWSHSKWNLKKCTAFKRISSWSKLFCWLWCWMFGYNFLLPFRHYSDKTCRSRRTQGNLLLINVSFYETVQLIYPFLRFTEEC